MSKIMMTSIQNWDEVYYNKEVGKQIGLQILSKLREDGFAYTHDGVYHADDLFCMALIGYALGNEYNFEFIRTRNLEHPYFTFDVGGGDFDHHQCDEYRWGDEGIFASFGKLWCTIGRTLGLHEEIWMEIDEQFVQAIDRTDNTGVMNPVNYVINSTKHRGLEEGLIIARSMANEILIEIIESGLQKSRELDDLYKEVESRDDSSPVLELSRHYVVNKEVYQSLDIDWIIFPDVKPGLFTVQAVGEKLLPEDLRGKSNEGDIVFTHKGGWVGKTIGIESARALVATAL
jgi:uncharacterized UPF0160 family protein